MFRIFYLLFIILALSISNNVYAFTNMFTQQMRNGGVADTATALAANGTNASTGNAILGVDASGNAEGSFDVQTQAEADAHESDTSSVHGITDTTKVLESMLTTDVDIADSGDGTSPDQEYGITANIEYEVITTECADTDDCTGSFNETNAAVGEQLRIVNNGGANDIAFVFETGVFEHKCGVGVSITLASGQSMNVTYDGTRWQLTGGSNSTECFETINLESGTINGGLKTVQVTAATYAMGTLSSDSWGTVILNYDNDVLAVTMETAVAGQQFCVKNAYGVSGAITVTPSAGDYLMGGGFGVATRGAAATAYVSSGAAGDQICVYCQDDTNCEITKEVGTWSE